MMTDHIKEISDLLNKYKSILVEDLLSNKSVLQLLVEETIIDKNDLEFLLQTDASDSENELNDKKCQYLIDIISKDGLKCFKKFCYTIEGDCKTLITALINDSLNYGNLRQFVVKNSLNQLRLNNCYANTRDTSKQSNDDVRAKAKIHKTSSIESKMGNFRQSEVQSVERSHFLRQEVVGLDDTHEKKRKSRRRKNWEFEKLGMRLILLGMVLVSILLPWCTNSPSASVFVNLSCAFESPCLVCSGRIRFTLSLLNNPTNFSYSSPSAQQSAYV